MTGKLTGSKKASQNGQILPVNTGILMIRLKFRYQVPV